MERHHITYGLTKFDYRDGSHEYWLAFNVENVAAKTATKIRFFITPQSYRAAQGRELTPDTVLTFKGTPITSDGRRGKLTVREVAERLLPKAYDYVLKYRKTGPGFEHEFWYNETPIFGRQ